MTPQQEEIYWIYIKWLAVPPADRTPKSLQEFSVRYSIDLVDLMTFQEQKTFGDDLNKETMKWAKRKTPAMLHSLHDKYQTTQSPQDFKVWQDAIKYAEENEKVTTLSDLVDNFSISEEQAVRVAQRIIEKYGKGK